MTDTLTTTSSQIERTQRGLTPIAIGILAALTVFIVLVGVQLTRQNQAPVAPGNPAPNFAVTTFDGDELTLDELAGSVVVMNFWASWCAPCHAEAEVLQATWEQYGEQDFVMLGITHADVERDSLRFIEQYSITYPNGPDPGARIYDLYGLTAVPETFLIAPDGTLAYVLRGPLNETTAPDFFTAIDGLLEAGA